MYSSINKNRFWEHLIGRSEHFSLNARVFHSVCVITLIALGYNIPFNYFIGLPLISLYSFLALLIFSFLYYNSLVNKKTSSSILTAGVIGYGLFVVNYFFNSGINGPTFLLFALALCLIITICESSHRVYWLVLNVVLVLGLHASEYVNPALIEDTYPNRLSRFVDSGSAYVITVVLIYFSVRFVKKNYDAEKRSSDLKALAISEQSDQIVRQNKKLEYVNGEKDKLFSIIAHDLRAPLISIQNYLELLSDDSLDAIQQQEFRQTLLATTKNTTNMMGNLLSWSRTQMDGVVCKPDNYNLAKLLAPTLQIESDNALRKYLKFTVGIDESITVFADADMLQLVVRNLLNNAIKFTPIGGKVSIEATAEGECVLAIMDTGMGIPADRQKKIFTLQAQSTYGTGNEKGVGLGLMLCKEFTELQGGRLWFESQPAVGTIFYLGLPCADTSAKPEFDA